ncbi:MAG: hypothetical protein K2I10_09395 [Lachnospiraceae bacterium]|nr:hypothetical protein [Lachnospiraceae bacterium]
MKEQQSDDRQSMSRKSVEISFYGSIVRSYIESEVHEARQMARHDERIETAK